MPESQQQQAGVDVAQVMREIRRRALELPDEPASSADPLSDPAESSAAGRLAQARAALDQANGVFNVFHQRLELVKSGYALDPSAWNQVRRQLSAKFGEGLLPPPEGGFKNQVKRLAARAIRFCFGGQESYNQQMRLWLDELFTLNAGLLGALNGLMQEVQRFEREYEQTQAKSAAFARNIYVTLDQIRRSVATGGPDASGAQVEREARLKHLLTETQALEDFNFLDWEARTRGPEERIKQQQDHYSTLFIGHQDVLDIGCGRGEFLELLEARRIRARGIDLDAAMARHCQLKGLSVEAGDALEHLAQLDAESLGGIFAAQVVEHLTVSELSRLCRQAFRVLRPGSPIVLETQNPTCLTVFSGAFYTDPTHVKPVHPETLRFFLERAGFRVSGVHFSAPVPEAEKLELLDAPDGAHWPELVERLNANFAKLNSVLYSYAHYAALAHKPERGAAA